MEEAERENFYDTEIAPALLELTKRCNANGLSFLAVVEWAPGEKGHTCQFVEPYGTSIDFARAASAAGNNVDSLIMYIMRKARETGHSSAFLHQLGVPTTPPEPL
tara:strand:+ start:11918 stop:12232 length:315 start_codon:yes stop_codon:yes gene_type:complete